jgi:hypothetical protein
MSRPTFTRWLALACCVLLPAAALRAQDAAQLAKDATAKARDIQKKLASGKDAADKDNPNLQRLRLDTYEATSDGLVKVTGVFLDPGTKPKLEADVWSPAFAAARRDAEKLILDTLKVKDADVKFDWTRVTRVGAVDAKGEPLNGFRPPQLLVQEAANKAGKDGDAAADHLALTGARFGPGGELILVGLRADRADAEKWLTDNAVRVLKEHPAASAPGGKPAVSGSGVKAVEWTVSAPALQKQLATAEDPLLHRLFVSRAYFVLDPASTDPDDRWNGLLFQTEGVQVGKGGVVEKLPRGVIEPIVKKLIPAQVDCRALVEGAAAEPVKELQLAVTRVGALDGVRVDPGFTFGPDGELLLAGLQPQLDPAGAKELEAVVRKGLTAYSKGALTPEKAEKYALLAGRPVSARGMTPVPVRKVLDDLRAWAKANKDDLKLVRLYFPEDVAPLKKRYFVDAGGLVLLYRPSKAADIKDVEAEFKRLLKADLEGGVPQPEGAPAPDAPADAPEPPAADKEPLLPGLTAHLRKVMAGDQKKWNGVLIERGYFDTKNQYTLAGVVDVARQNEDLANLLDELKADPKWADYFNPPPAKPALDVIPMSELLDRVKRVTPAYPAFDGIRIESARYDATGNLIFDAHVVGEPDRAAAPLLAKLIRENPTFKRRAPADKLVLLVRGEGPTYSDDQVGDFSTALGAKLLAKADASKEDRAKAKEWLDVALLHYPNEAAVWFLSAYYNLAIAKDEELARRDLYRTIDLEGPLAFNGPAQRKRRYEVARDLQGVVRNNLEALWLDCFREVKDGAKPMPLVPKK